MTLGGTRVLLNVGQTSGPMIVCEAYSPNCPSNGEEASLTQFLSSWHFDLFWAVNLSVVTLAYGLGVHRVQVTSPRTWPAWRALCFFAGLILLASVYLGPIAYWGSAFFWSHMTQHLVVTMAAAPLLVLGAPVTLAFRASNDAHRRAIARVLRSTTVRWLTNPVLTWLVFATVLIGAHFTPFYDWSLSNHGVMLMIEQPMFLAAALLYYFPVLGGNLLPHPPSAGQRLASLGLMMIPEAIVGAAIYFSPVVLYDNYETVRPFGLQALEDQQLSGALMWSLVMVIDSFWMMWVAAEWWTAEERRGRRMDAELQRQAESA